MDDPKFPSVLATHPRAPVRNEGSYRAHVHPPADLPCPGDSHLPRSIATRPVLFAVDPAATVGHHMLRQEDGSDRCTWCSLVDNVARLGRDKCHRYEVNGVPLTKLGVHAPPPECPRPVKARTP